MTVRMIRAGFFVLGYYFLTLFDSFFRHWSLQPIWIQMVLVPIGLFIGFVAVGTAVDWYKARR